MRAFSLFLIVCLTTIVIYTAITITNHGVGLLSVFLADIAAMAWPGQFNLDFTTFLALSAIWVSWRHHFSPGGLALGMLAFFGGMLFLSIYLLVQIHRTAGDVKTILLGDIRAR